MVHGQPANVGHEESTTKLKNHRVIEWFVWKGPTVLWLVKPGFQWLCVSS